MESPPPIPGQKPPKNSRHLLWLIPVVLVLFAVAFFFVAKTAFFQVQKSHKAREHRANLDRLITDTRQSQKESFDPVNGITNVDHAKMNELRQELNTASKNLPEKEARLFKAVSGFLEKMQNSSKEYEVVLQEFLSAEVLNCATLTNQTQFASRSNVTERFLAANARLTGVMENAENSFAEELHKTKASEKDIKAALAGYRNKSRLRNQYILQIRGCDKELGTATLAVLGLLEREWGKWKYDPMEELVNFERDEVAEDYNQHFKKLQQAASKQLVAQKKLVNLP